MGDRKPRSKKHSTSKKPLKGFTLYLCHCVDYDEVANALQRSGLRFRRHREFFSGETPDTELLKKVGKHRWILITADKKQRTRHLERQMIILHKVREFVITAPEVSDVGELLLKAMRQMRNLCRRNNGPFVASVSQGGNVTVKALN